MLQSVFRRTTSNVRGSCLLGLQAGLRNSRLRQFSSGNMRPTPLDSYLVTPAQLYEVLNDQSSPPTPEVIPLCASWFLPNDAQKRTGRQVYEAERIPGARFFDIDGVKDVNSPYPHMLPSAEEFAHAMGQMGIGNDDAVVVYDTKELGIFSAPRVGWTLRAFGHQKVHVLNNFRLWIEDFYPTEEGKPPGFTPKTYKAPKEAIGAVDFEFVKKVARGDQPGQILDGRPKGRFDGTDPEPRPGLAAGHYPGSLSVEFSDLLDPNTKAILPPTRLVEVLRAKGIPEKGPFISACGSGVTAAIIDVALAAAGHPQESRYLYDGSWTEWAQRVKPEEELIVKS